jgi:hypothetical protein
MKRGTPDHPKTMRLARALGCGKAQAIGHLELLWHFTGRLAPQGNVGKWDDTEIAEACAAECDGAVFVSALVQSGWLDVCECHRLVVHDWHEHAERTTHKFLEYHKKPFVDCVGKSPTISKNVGKSRPSRARARVGRGRGSGSGSGRDVLEGGVGGTPADPFDAFWRVYPRKVAKGDARKAWARLTPDAALVATILAAVEAQTTWPQWQRDDGDFIPYPATWLNRGQWTDEAPKAHAVPLFTKKGQQTADAAAEWLRRTTPDDPVPPVLVEAK